MTGAALLPGSLLMSPAMCGRFFFFEDGGLLEPPPAPDVGRALDALWEMKTTRVST